MSIFILLQHYFDYCSFVVLLFEIRKYDVSFFVLLSNSFGHLKSFIAPYILKDFFFYFSEKCLWNFDMGCSESIDGFGDDGHFNNINFCSP